MAKLKHAHCFCHSQVYRVNVDGNVWTRSVQEHSHPHELKDWLGQSNRITDMVHCLRVSCEPQDHESPEVYLDKEGQGTHQATICTSSTPKKGEERFLVSRVVVLRTLQSSRPHAVSYNLLRSTTLRRPGQMDPQLGRAAATYRLQLLSLISSA